MSRDFSGATASCSSDTSNNFPLTTTSSLRKGVPQPLSLPLSTTFPFDNLPLPGLLTPDNFTPRNTFILQQLPQCNNVYGAPTSLITTLISRIRKAAMEMIPANETANDYIGRCFPKIRSAA